MNRREALRRMGRAVGACGVFRAAGVAPGQPPRSSRRRASSCPELRGARVRWLVGWSPGGGYDTYSRLLEPLLERELGAQIVIENLPGGGGLVAARRISGARPDGRTLGVLNGTGLMISPFSNPGFAPDLATDFTILGRLARHSQAFFVSRDLGIHTIEDLVASRDLRHIVLAETGPGTVNLLLGALLEDLFGLRVEHVMGFPGSREVVGAVQRGYVDGAVLGLETVRPDEGLVPLLHFGTVDGRSDPRWENVPSLSGPTGLVSARPDVFVDPVGARADGLGIESLTQVGRLVAAPPNLPPGLRDCLRSELEKVLADFVESVREGRSPAVTGEHGRAVVEIADAILEAIKGAQAAVLL